MAKTKTEEIIEKCMKNYEEKFGNDGGRTEGFRKGYAGSDRQVYQDC